MEKYKDLPKNWINNLKKESYFEPYSEPYYYSSNMFGKPNFDNYRSGLPVRMRYTLEITIEPNSNEDYKLIDGLTRSGLEYVRNLGLNLEKFKYVINAGFTKLPILLKDPDPEVAELAFILSKYFANRNDIIPDKVIE